MRPLGDEDAVGGGDLGLLDEGSELVARELTRETIDELGTAGVGKCDSGDEGWEV